MDQGEQQVITALESAGSPVDASLRRRSELELAEWANKPWFHSTVQNIYLNPNYTLQVRWLAVIYLKNSVQNHWRRTCVNPVLPEEKELIRSRAFDCITEPNKKLNAQHAAALGKIARIDFSKDWQNLFDQFNTCVLEKYRYDSQSYSREQLLALYNGLEILDQILKSLATAKFGNVRTLLHKHAPPLIPKITHIYVTLVTQWTQDFDLAKMEVGYKALKIVTRLIYDDVEYPNRNADAQRFFIIIKDHLTAFMQEYEKRSEVSDLLFKHMKRIGKFYLRLLENEPVAFMLMDQTVQVFHLYLAIIDNKAEQITYSGDLSKLSSGSHHGYEEDEEDDDDEDETTAAWTKIVIQGLTMLSNVLQMIKRKGVNSIKSRTDDDRREAAECANIVTQVLFTPEVVSRLASLILNNYFRIVHEDVKHWRRDPEEFFIEENEHESWQYQLRPCATRFFGFLIGCYDIASQIMEFVENALKQSDISLQDSALHALEHSGIVLSQKGVSLNELMLQLLQMKDMDNIIIRRRLCAIITEWISLDILDVGVKTLIYQTLVGDFLNPVKANESDIVVLLTASNALRYSVDEYQFNAESFVPFIDPAFKGLFAIVNRLKTIECKVSIVHVIDVLIEQLQTHILPYSESVLQILPPLWEEAQEKHHIKGLVLQTLLSLIRALRSQSIICHAIAIPLIRVSCDPQSPEYAYLLEDGLPLWDALLENAESLSAESLSLIDLLYENLRQPSEIIVQHFEIVNKYTVLSQPNEEFARGFSTHILPIISGYLSLLKSEVFTSAVAMLELVAECFSLESYGSALLATGVLGQLVAYVLKEDSSVISTLKVFNFFSRMAIQNPSQFWSLVGDEQTRANLVAVWLKKFDNIGHPKDMKLNGLGLTAVLSTCDYTVLTNLKSFIDIWCDLLDQVNEEDDANRSDSQLYYTNEELYEESQPEQEMTMHQKRMIAIRKQRDPVHCISLKRSVQVATALEPIKNAVSQLPDDIVILLQQLIKSQ